MANRDVATDQYFFHSGNGCRVFGYLGQHREGDCRVFRVWAPDAVSTELTGDFSGWKGMPMERVSEKGVWEIRTPDRLVSVGDMYKYRFTTRDGREIYKADPYGTCTECPPGTASRVYDTDGYVWHDAGWLRHRKKYAKNVMSRPLNIYELNVGSWNRHDDGTEYNWCELATELAPYVKQMGYTHIELMPVMEHPFEGSWGYQLCGYYAPSARWGTPRDFMAFVDSMHTAGIGVILDWVPAHFPKDAHGLYEFDGQPLYEYQGADRQENRGWGTRCFDLGREEVKSFLISNAVFWAEVYHADGLRVDAVTSMLYLDYDREPGQWIPNIYGGNVNLEAQAFLRQLNMSMKREYPDVMMIAEESTSIGKITTQDGDGLGFTFKWNMGWMNDTLAYVVEDPIYRCYHHDKLTFPLTYAFYENYILPISHDEVVHGKKSLIDKMPGDYWRKFAGVRAFACWMIAHPGKKLMFMGCEIGQFREWDYEGHIEWFLLGYEAHAKLQLFFSELNRLYLSTPPMWENDSSWDGFKWIDANNSGQSIVSLRRISSRGDEVIFVINFTPATYENYDVTVPDAGIYKEIFNSDSERYGGSGVTNEGASMRAERPTPGNPPHITLRIPPLGCTVLRCERKFPKPRMVTRTVGLSRKKSVKQ